MSAAARQTFRVAPLPSALLEDPIAFLSAEHARQLVLLSHLDRLAQRPAARGARGLAAVLLHWLDTELPLHVADEEVSLYPRLLAHDPRGVLARLAQDHDGAAGAKRGVVEALRLLGGEQRAPAGFPAAGAALVRLVRAHISTEEAVVTPLARAVLTPAVLAAISVEMVARRGLVLRPA
jgi:hypothetical protein